MRVGAVGGARGWCLTERSGEKELLTLTAREIQDASNPDLGEPGSLEEGQPCFVLA